MSKPTTASTNLPKPLGHPRNGIRLFRDDDEAITALVEKIQQSDFKMVTTEMIRDCVSAGLPIMMSKWKPVVDKLAKQ